MSSQMEKISAHFKCGICLGIIKNCTAIQVCLHRFCRNCIEQSLRRNNKECPICQTPCASRRSLLDDTPFQWFINSFYPDRKALEIEEINEALKLLGNAFYNIK